MLDTAKQVYNDPGGVLVPGERTEPASSPCLPSVSVLMPVYNAAPYLREAIDSILAQTYTDLELIVVDDGSTDESGAIARSYMDARIRILAAAHRGLVAARNTALQAARGEFIACMDADDVSAPERLAKQVAYMHAHPNVVVVGTWARLIDTKSNLLGTTIMPPAGGERLHMSLCVANQLVNGSTAMRRQAVLAAGGYREGYAPAEDYDLWFRLSELGQLANIADSLYCLRMHPKSTIARTGVDGVADRARAAQKSAVQRRMERDCSRGHVRIIAPQTSLPEEQCGARMVALTDWAQMLFWQGQWGLAIRLLWLAFLCHPRGSFSPRIVAPNSLSTMYWREVLQAMKQGMWVELARAKAHRVAARVVKVTGRILLVSG